MSARVPVMLTIAGSDPSGGAGIQADVKTASALGVYAATVLTALTAQNTRGVTGIHAVPPQFVRDQFDAVATDLDIRAVKIGMLGDAALVETVADLLTAHPVPAVVLDPVMVATSGDPLVPPDAVAAIRDLLLPLATVVTPNLAEAHTLTDLSVADEEEMEAAGRALVALGAGAALVKGGHGTGAEANDVLVSTTHVRWFGAPRLDTPNTHGTGCTLSSGIAAGLVRGLALDDAVALAKDFLTRALRSSAGLTYGSGHGPVDHLVDLHPGSPA